MLCDPTVCRGVKHLLHATVKVCLRNIANGHRYRCLAFAALSKQRDTLTAVHCGTRIRLRHGEPTREPQLIVARSRLRPCTYRYVIMHAISFSFFQIDRKRYVLQFSSVPYRLLTLLSICFLDTRRARPRILDVLSLKEAVEVIDVRLYNSFYDRIRHSSERNDWKRNVQTACLIRK